MKNLLSSLIPAILSNGAAAVERALRIRMMPGVLRQRKLLPNREGNTATAEAASDFANTGLTRSLTLFRTQEEAERLWGFSYPPLPFPIVDEELTPEEKSDVVPASTQSLDHGLAKLFIRLGSPPEPTETKYAPGSNGDGGAQQ